MLLAQHDLQQGVQPLDWLAEAGAETFVPTVFEMIQHHALRLNSRKPQVLHSAHFRQTLWGF